MTETELPPEAGTMGSGAHGSAAAMDPLPQYAPPDPAADIFAAADPSQQASWRAFAAGLAAQGQGKLSELQPHIDHHVEDLGLAFRLTGDEHERAWPLNPMPIFIGATEWAGIEAGLVQRANLLEAVLADIYGPQQLVADGHLPAAVVSGSGGFARRMVGMRPPGGHFLHIYAVDLARGPAGEWRVLADRAQLTIGLGFALENRLAMTRATGGLLASIGTRRLTPFFDALRQGLAADCERAEPRIGILTPGRFNQSYPEQAHLARHLGFSLVEGRDLTVNDGRLYVRTIAGLKRIDALWRWIKTRDSDPLNFDARSQIGVPGLIDAAAHGLVLANWPGAGVIESRAMPAFLPRLSRILFNEPLRLPNAATWWCGGESERAQVLARLDELVISSAFRLPVAGLPDGHTRVGRLLSSAEREQIVAGMALRPMDYTAQEIVSLSTTPIVSGDRFEPRGFTLRAFLARNGEGQWVALPGGFARVSEHGDLRTSLMGLGDISTDVCILDPSPIAPGIAAGPANQAPRRDLGLLPSQAADNLYWLGRYGERAHQIVRIVRTLIEQVGAANERDEAFSTVQRLADLLRGLGAVPPVSTSWQPSRIAAAALSDSKREGSVRGLAASGRQIALLLRDRLTRDSWRAIHRPLPAKLPEDFERIAVLCDDLVERFAAIARLTADGMSRGAAWHFLDMGLCIERASIVLQAVRPLTGGTASSDDLAALLDLVDAQTLYRSRYLASPTLAPVIDLVMLDPAHPRCFAYQVVQIEQHLASLPDRRDDGMLEQPLRLARQLIARIEAVDADGVNEAFVAGLQAALAQLSNAIASRYFLHAEPPSTRETASFLG
ncbi:circularly permuted type 2 ATP-grasp protein [Novosphingobium kunmingense]|nr:circularly permuted type 2 ATP-grasp protein [Novosphingobium kunmingense]